MKNLTTKVLIIDDIDEAIDDYEQILCSFADQKGFRCEVTHINSFIDFSHIELKNAEYDFFMVDYNMGQSSKFNGDKLIEKIRVSCPVSDILFYSSDHDQISNFQKAHVIEGVYYSERDYESNKNPTADKAIELFGKTIKWFEQPYNIRGILLESLSGFDSKIKDCISRCYLSSIPQRKNEIKGSFIPKINESCKSRYIRFLKMVTCSDEIRLADIKKTHPCLENADFSTLLLDFNIVDSKRQFILFFDLLKDAGFENLDKLNKLYNDLSEKRNILAHCQGEQQRTGIFYKNSTKSILFDRDACAFTRKDILSFDDLLDSAICFLDNQLHG